MKLSRINDKLCVDVILAPGTHTLESSLWHEIMARVLSAKFPSMRPERRSGSKDWGTPDFYVRCDRICPQKRAFRHQANNRHEHRSRLFFP
jgi:hypothetical protein